jgi:hypothetical protein
MKCWKHPARRAVACGTFTRRGYCRGCWPRSAAIAKTCLSPVEAHYWPARVPKMDDMAMWLGA